MDIDDCILRADHADDTEHLRRIMSDLLFPKEKKKPRRMRHPDSIIQKKNKRCYLCQLVDNNYSEHRYIERHHIYDGPNRKVSEENGFVVYLCVKHHREGPAAVHNNSAMNRMIQKACQRVYERSHSREEFMALIGRSYI